MNETVKITWQFVTLQVLRNITKTFIETTYPELHQTDFFQPNDMLFIFPEYNQLVMLHHEGYFLQFQRPK